VVHTGEVQGSIPCAPTIQRQIQIALRFSPRAEKTQETDINPFSCVRCRVNVLAENTALLYFPAMLEID
jgi:hypothetical protein